MYQKLNILTFALYINYYTLYQTRDFMIAICRQTFFAPFNQLFYNL